MMHQKGKLVIFSAPSGSGKTTIVHHLLQLGLGLEFSISATSRSPRGQEKDGVDYYFLSTEEFKKRISGGDFLEFEEVYQGTYYGTLRSEVDRITSKGKHIVFDVDVVGGLNIKKLYGERAISIFIQPPSLEELNNRLVKRGTDTSDKIRMRLAKAEEEITYSRNFDFVIVNDNLESAKKKAEIVLSHFLNSNE